MPTFEAHISDQANTAATHNSQDSILYALPISFTYGSALTEQEQNDWFNSKTVNDPGSKYRTSDWIEGGEFIVNPAYRTDRESDVRAFEGGFYWKPGDLSRIGLNIRQRVFDSIPNFLTYRWDPMVGAEIGDYEGGSKLPAGLPKDYARGFFRVHGELGIGSEDKTPFTLAADYTVRQEVESSHDSHSFWEISLIYNIDPDRAVPAEDVGGKKKNVIVPGHLKVGATWTGGKDAPTFKEVNTYTAWVGLQF